MAKVSAKNAAIVISTISPASTFVASYEIEWGQDVIDATGFTDGWQNYISGIPIVGVTLDLFWDQDLVKALKTMMTTAATLSIKPETGFSFSGTFICDGLKPTGQASSGAAMMNGVHFSPSGVTLATFATE